MARELDRTLVRICESYSPRRYLEIGTREGASLKTVLAHTELDLVCVCDTWGKRFGGSGRGDHKHIARILEQLSYLGEVIYLDGRSSEMIPTLKRRFDLCLVDGDHTRAGAEQDLKNCWRLLEPGGVLVFDDICLHPDLLEVCEQWLKRSDCAEIMRVESGNGNLAFWKKPVF